MAHPKRSADSVNKIDSLRDFAACPKLQELYLRKNDIRNLEDVRPADNEKFLQKSSSNFKTFNLVVFFSDLKFADKI